MTLNTDSPRPDSSSSSRAPWHQYVNNQLPNNTTSNNNDYQQPTSPQSLNNRPLPDFQSNLVNNSSDIRPNSSSDRNPLFQLSNNDNNNNNNNSSRSLPESSLLFDNNFQNFINTNNNQSRPLPTPTLTNSNPGIQQNNFNNTTNNNTTNNNSNNNSNSSFSSPRSGGRPLPQPVAVINPVVLQQIKNNLFVMLDAMKQLNNNDIKGHPQLPTLIEKYTSPFKNLQMLQGIYPYYYISLFTIIILLHIFEI
jgi:hypothetical protein